MHEYVKGPYSDLCAAVNQFFGAVAGDRALRVYSSLQIRRELFKLYYEEDSFDLYCKADPCEVISKLLKALHLSTKCRDGHRCFVHEKFFLNRVIQESCYCGEKGDKIYQDHNTFMENFVTDEIITKMKEMTAEDSEFEEDKVDQYKNMQGLMMKAVGENMEE